MGKFKKKLEELRNTERKSDCMLGELNGDIMELLLKYSDFTYINNLQLKEVRLISYLIEDIINDPSTYIK